MNKKLRIAATGILLGWIAWRTDWSHVRDALGNMRVELWLLAVAVGIGAQVVSSLRWQLLARPLGFQLPLRRYVAFYFVGMFFNLVLPTSVGGDVVRAWYLDAGSGRRLKAFLSVFLERLSGLLILLTLACVAVAVCPLDLPAWIPLGVWGTAAVITTGLAIVPLLARHHRFGLHHASVFRELPRSFLSVLRPGSLALSVVVQAASVAQVWLIGCAIHAPVPASYYWILVPMVSLATLLPISLNGMGVREGCSVLLLAPLGVSTGTALSLAFLWFVAGAVASLTGAAFYLFGRFPRFKVKSDDGSVGGDSDQGRTGQPEAAA